MPSCFHNESGFMFGIDVHKYIAKLPNGLPSPVQNPYVVTLAFSQLLRLKDHKKIRMDGSASFEAGADFYLVSHQMLPVLPPHELQAVVYATIVLGAGSKIWMGVHGVTLNGARAGVCLEDWHSWNQNCSDPFDGVSAHAVVNFNSVVTQPTPGDLAGSAAGFVVDALLSWLVGIGLDKYGEKILDGAKRSKPMQDALNDLINGFPKQVWRRLSDIVSPEHPITKFIFDAPNFVTEQVQKVVDGGKS